MTYEGYKLARIVITSVGQFCFRMFSPLIVLLVYPISLTHCCIFNSGNFGPVYFNVSGKSFWFSSFAKQITDEYLPCYSRIWSEAPRDRRMRGSREYQRVCYRGWEWSGRSMRFSLHLWRKIPLWLWWWWWFLVQHQNGWHGLSHPRTLGNVFRWVSHWLTERGTLYLQILQTILLACQQQKLWSCLVQSLLI